MNEVDELGRWLSREHPLAPVFWLIGEGRILSFKAHVLNGFMRIFGRSIMTRQLGPFVEIERNR